jgi:uncharacterized membrane protein
MVSAVNDPTTTVQALNSMGSVFVALGSNKLPQKIVEYEANGSRVLIRINQPSFDEVIGVALDQTRRAAFSGGYVTVLATLLEVMERALAANTVPQRQEAIWKRVYLLAWQTVHTMIFLTPTTR